MSSLNTFTQLSLFDKLQTQATSTSISAEMMIESLNRDIESLLNTRNNGSLFTKQDDSLTRSIVNYGLADFALFNLLATDDQARLCQHIEELLIRYEPRLLNPKVSILPQTSESTFTWQFQINGELKLVDEQYAVAFSSALDLAGGYYRISGALYE